METPVLYHLSRHIVQSLLQALTEIFASIILYPLAELLRGAVRRLGAALRFAFAAVTLQRQSYAYFLDDRDADGSHRPYQRFANYIVGWGAIITLCVIALTSI